MKTKWCTWSQWGKKIPEHVGQIFDYNECSGHIIYSENQTYPPAVWDMRYVEVFETAEDAIIFTLKNNSSVWLSEIREYWSFPSAKIDWNKISIIEDDIRALK